MTDRLFVAIWPDPGSLAVLRSAVAQARTVFPDLRWQPEERWHLTLAFLGEADEHRARDRLERLLTGRAHGRAAPGAHPLHLAGSGAFGPIVWVGIEHGPWLTQLAETVQRTLRVTDRRFRAHITVGRARGRPGPAKALAREVVPALGTVRGPAWTPDSLTLVRSRTGPDPEYSILERWALHAGDGPA